MADSNPGPLPHKSGALPMNHHISKANTSPVYTRTYALQGLKSFLVLQAITIITYKTGEKILFDYFPQSFDNCFVFECITKKN